MPVYFIQDSGTRRIKIGYAEDVVRRMATLQTGASSRLVLLLVVPGDGRLERRLHKRFARSRRRGEWFRPDPEVLRFMLGAAGQAVGGPPPAPSLSPSDEEVAALVRDAAAAAERAYRRGFQQGMHAGRRLPDDQPTPAAVARWRRARREDVSAPPPGTRGPKGPALDRLLMETKHPETLQRFARRLRNPLP